MAVRIQFTSIANALAAFLAESGSAPTTMYQIENGKVTDFSIFGHPCIYRIVPGPLEADFRVAFSVGEGSVNSTKVTSIFEG